MTGVLYGIDLPVVARTWTSESGGVFHVIGITGQQYKLTLAPKGVSHVAVKKFISGPTDAEITSTSPHKAAVKPVPVPVVATPATTPAVNPPAPETEEFEATEEDSTLAFEGDEP